MYVFQASFDASKSRSCHETSASCIIKNSYISAIHYLFFITAKKLISDVILSVCYGSSKISRVIRQGITKEVYSLVLEMFCVNDKDMASSYSLI